MGQSFLFVRSQDRSLGTSSSFKVVLPQTYRNVTNIALVSAELPSVYNIDGLYVQGVTFSYNGTSFQMVLQPGFYQITDLQNALLYTLQTTLPSAGVTAVTYSQVTGISSIIFSGAGTFSVVSTAAGLLGRVLGCDPSNTATFGSAGILTFPYVATLSPMTTALLQIAEIPSILTTTNSIQAFARIQLNAAPGSIAMANAGASVYNNNTYQTPISTLSSITATLLSTDGLPMNMRGLEWSFALVLQFS